MSNGKDNKVLNKKGCLMIFMSHNIRQTSREGKVCTIFFYFSYAHEYQNRIKRNPSTHIKLTLQAWQRGCRRSLYPVQNTK